MNENNITLMAMPAQEQNEAEIDLLDLLAVVLLKWKAIVALLLVGAVIGCGAALLKGGGETEAVTKEAALAEAKAQVSSDKALAVEQLFFQYVSYKELQEDMRAYYSTFAASDVNLDNTVRMRAKFYISSSVEKLEQIFSQLMLAEEDYRKMREISPDEEAGATIYDRVSIGVVSNDRITVTNLDGEEQAPIQYLLNVQLYGHSEEQCREMMQIIETAIRREADLLKELDPQIKLTAAGEEFDYNVVSYVQNLRKSNIDKMTVSEKELNDLTTKVGKLSSEEKDYYNLLMKQYDEAFAVEKHISWKKWTVIGAFLGAVLACCAVFFGYLINGKVKSPCELEQGGRLLSRVFIKGKNNLFGKWAAGLIHADDTDPTVKADMVATDISILMEKNGKCSLMLLCSQEDIDAAGFAEQVKARLLAKNDDLNVSVGNPTRSVEELEVAAQADMGVVIAEMKKSKRAMLREWRQICARYKLPLAGSVAVQRCW